MGIKIYPEKLENIPDVNLGTLSDNENVTWDAASSRFTNQAAGTPGAHTHDTVDIVSGTLANARVAESNVTQHVAAINHDALLNFSTTEHFTMLDEDNMSSNSATKAATQQSVKAYVDAQVATSDTLPELSDVVITTVADNEVLAYNSGTSKWINQTAAEASLAAASHNHAASDINSGTLADAIVAQSNVTQHQAALSVTESQISDLDHDAAKIKGVGIVITSVADNETLTYDSASAKWTNQAAGTPGAHTHDTSDIVSGTMANARISVGSVTQHEASIDHDALANFVAAEHLLVGAIDHDQLLNFASNEHFTEASISQVNLSDVTAWATWTPTYGAFSPMTFGSVTTTYARWRQYGETVEFAISAVGTTGGSASPYITFTLNNNPDVASLQFATRINDGGDITGFCFNGSGADIAKVFVQRYDGANWGVSSGRSFTITGSYEIT